MADFISRFLPQPGDYSLKAILDPDFEEKLAQQPVPLLRYKKRPKKSLWSVWVIVPFYGSLEVSVLLHNQGGVGSILVAASSCFSRRLLASTHK